MSVICWSDGLHRLAVAHLLFRCKDLGDHRITVPLLRFELRGGRDLYILEVSLPLFCSVLDMLHLRGVRVGVDVDFVVLLHRSLDGR